MERVLARLPWRQPEVTVFGRRHPIPRRQCYLALPGCEYRYSGTLLTPEPLPREVADLMQWLNRQSQAGFNSVLANTYRDGGERMGWHRDNEPELGPSPPLAIVSFGARRRLRLRWTPKDSQAIELAPGSVLWLAPGVWHCLPASRRAQAPRTSLTFRRVIPGFYRSR
ncbi:alpha-ketoglutarate-dependent dioxygenase AlkB [Ferrimonas pelagia]|uniref:Alpha-ketoglutarate-dependent dioxygenase AlkB n=2 Tax=Ferrimonas pelagia TaxID=1177826 RepID=A0ABP9EHM9_9GAMM